MPYDAVPKPAAPSPILDRFRQLLKERETDFDSMCENGVPCLSSDDIVRCYKAVLSELTFNSKPIITDLTIIAGEHREHGDGIADAICARVLEVPVEQKLPSLYLLDSIVKNIGREYVGHFADRLPEVFCEVYRQVPPNLYPSMRHLFGTWSTVFPSWVLRKIEDELQFSPRMNQPSSTIANMRASESPRPSHGIHVNLNYLEARRQFDNSSTKSNVQLSKEEPNPKMLGQKVSNVYEDYDPDMVDGRTYNVGAKRFSSTGFGGSTSLPLLADKLPSSVSGQGRPLSPSVGEFDMSKAPGRIFEKSSLLLPGYNNGRRVRGIDEETGDWQKKLRSDDLYRGFENVASYSFSNGLDHDRPRALIDAYGHDDGQRTLNEKPLGINRGVVNGTASKIAPRSWQNTEEEEFDWEDMSPTLADSKTSNLTPSSSLPFGPGQDPPGSRPFGARWLTSNQICRLEDPQKHVDDASLIRDTDHGLSNKFPLTRNGINQNTEPHHSQGAWKLSGSLTEPVQDSSRLTVSASGVHSSFPDRKSPQEDDFTAVSNVTSRVVSSGFNSFEASTLSPAVAPVSAGYWPPMSANNIMPLPRPYPQHPPLRGPVDFMNPSYKVLKDDNRIPVPVKPTHLQRPGFTPLPPLSRPPVPLQSQLPSSEELRQSAASTVAPLPPPMMRPPVSFAYTPLGPGGVAASNMMNNLIPTYRSSLPFQNVSNSFVQFQPPMPPLPPGPRPPSQILPASLSSGPLVNQLPTAGVSGLINSLVAQGVLSLAKQTTAQDSLGIEFNADLLKVRHESSIRALYDDLPRQCTTCGLRFKTQEEHSKHMDWHVAKNRISKNRKHSPSRKWFVSASMWLSGAEALGTDAAPGFLPAETAVEKKDDEELAVPADEDQTSCALCGESFEDFYSDETEEWMYRGAVYLNTPPYGSVVGMDRSQLGPIVHAKCRSDTSTAPS